MKTSDFPSGCTNLGPGLLEDVNGYVWRKDEDSDEWHPENPSEMALLYEKTLEKTIVDIFSGALDSDGDAVQVRRVNGRLTWIKSNKGGEKWKELTPELARQIEVAVILEAQKNLNAEVAEELKKIKVGWYQDVKGNLYQFNGSEWVGQVPSKKQIESLEFLG